MVFYHPKACQDTDLTGHIRWRLHCPTSSAEDLQAAAVAYETPSR